VALSGPAGIVSLPRQAEKAAPTRQPPAADSRVATAADAAPALSNTSGNSEIWSYVLLLEDGILVHLSLFRSNMGFPVGRVSGAELSVIGMTTDPVAMLRQYPDSNFEYRADGAVPRIAVHPRIWVEGSPLGSQTLRFDSTKRGVRLRLDVRIEDPEPAAVWKEGVFEVGGNRIGWIPLIARGGVTGTLQIDDVSRPIRGTVYTDHSFITDRPDRLIETVYQFAAHEDPWAVGMVLRTSRRAGRTHVGYVVEPAGSGAVARPISAVEGLFVERYQDVYYPQRVDLRTPNGLLSLTEATARQRFSLLADLSSIKRLLFRTFIGGELVFVRGDGLIDERRFAYSYRSVR
jgi:hypothetical protein